jgi:endonuclease/exonuclease/phosphatase (EEP) superfamily protein YafD
MWIHTTLYFSGLFVLLTSLIPFIRNDAWVFRVFEYPRLQKFILNIIILALLLWVAFPNENWEWWLAAALALNGIYLGWLIYPFTPLAKKQIVGSTRPHGPDNIKILIANVYQHNQRAADYLQLMKQSGPDVVLLVETNTWWQQQLDAISDKYPHQIKVPPDNTYGMLLYSRLPLTEGAVAFLVEKDIPSIETMVTLESGQQVKLFCLHPTPPVPQENPRSTERDKEILLVGKKAKQLKCPVIVIGDLNDVAWSYTTKLFGKISGLLDPRRGRGFYNSFHAKYFFLRFPLDHVFCSTDFTLSDLRRLPACGSDHYPMFVNLQYNPPAKKENEAPKASAYDKELADEKINAG